MSSRRPPKHKQATPTRTKTAIKFTGHGLAQLTDKRPSTDLSLLLLWTKRSFTVNQKHSLYPCHCNSLLLLPTTYPPWAPNNHHHNNIPPLIAPGHSHVGRRCADTLLHGPRALHRSTQGTTTQISQHDDLWRFQGGNHGLIDDVGNECCCVVVVGDGTCPLQRVWVSKEWGHHSATTHHGSQRPFLDNILSSNWYAGQ